MKGFTFSKLQRHATLLKMNYFIGIILLMLTVIFICVSKFKNNYLQGKHSVKSVQIRSFFWSVFSRIRTEYGEIRTISPYLLRMRENTDQKTLRIWTIFTHCNQILFCDTPKIIVVVICKQSLRQL